MFPLRRGVFGRLKISARERERRGRREELIDVRVVPRSGEDSSREKIAEKCERMRKSSRAGRACI